MGSGEWGMGGAGGDEGEELIINAPCPMPHAQCPMPHAQCPMIIDYRLLTTDSFFITIEPITISSAPNARNARSQTN
ncbi:MAG: hypothetical protein V7L04_29960 [Nostoc sp.]|uniref:hypothetical protein n=1 Tax=Nostoc sp. TaxID=1180 RepID=UPI002FFB9E86